VRAVNLIPADVAGGGRTSAGPLMLLGGLAVLLALVTAHVLTGNTIKERRSELVSVHGQLAVAQAQADATRPYREFAALARARVDTVRQLGSARFDWHRAFADLSTVIPDDVWLSSLTGTVTTGVSVAGGDSGGASTLRAAIPSPAIELSGCTVSHEGVVRLISRLRLLHTVQRVSLADSSKNDGGDCQHGHTNFPAFHLVVFFAPIPTVQAPATAQSGTAAPVADTSGGTSTPPPATTTPAPPGGATTSPQGGGNG
jgi:Tfp pilus assembly protein PilN